MHHRKIAAQSALKFFTDIKNIRSTNIPGCEDLKGWNIIKEYRDKKHVDSAIDAFLDSAKSGYGNCGEKAAIVFTSLSRNPRLIPNSFVYLAAIASDHMFVVITDKGICNLRGYQKLNSLSLTTLVVDGFTEDWYFPNVDTLTEYATGFMNITTTALQAYSRYRCKIQNHRIFPLNIF